MRAVKNLEDIFPVWKIEKDCILDKQGCVTAAYSIVLPEIFTVSNEQYAKIHNAFVRAVSVLPVGCVLHKQDLFFETNWNVDFVSAVEADQKSFLQHSSDKFFNERKWLNHTACLYLTLPPESRHPGSLLNHSVVPSSVMDEKRVSDFLDSCGQFCQILEESSLLTIKRLVADDLSSSDAKPGVIERYVMGLGIHSHRLIRDIRIRESLAIGSTKIQVFSLCDPEDLPPACGPRINYDPYATHQGKFPIGFAAPLGLLLPVDHIYNQYIIVQDAQAITQRLEKKRLRMQSLCAYSRQNATNRDAVNEYLNEAIGQGRIPVKAHFNVMAFSESDYDAREVKNKIIAAMSQLGIKTKEETQSAGQLFLNGIPGSAFGLSTNETFLTFLEQACCFLNLETNYQDSISPVGIRLSDRLSGIPIHVDLSDEPIAQGITTNRNKFVLGPSGTGKSVFCNHLIRSYVEQGAHAVIVDVGHSYRGLCELLDGYYFTYTQAAPIRFNPFFVQGGLDTEKKEGLKTLLLALWKKDDQTFTRSEYVALSNVLEGFYKSNPGFACFNSFYEFLQTDFVESLKKDGVSQKDFDVTNFLYVLKPYYKGGEFDYLLNASEQLDLLGQRLIVFELDTIKDHPILFPVVTLVIMDLFITKMRKLKGIRKIILIEEAWKSIARQGMAEYIKYLFKTVRKFFGEAIVVTQDVEDIISSPIVRDAIINNSDCKILLDQAKYINRFEYIQDLLGLTDKEKILVLSINKANDPTRKYKEVFISLGGTHSRVYRVELSMEEYLAYTTEEKEKVQVAVYANRYGSLQKGIKVLANHLLNPLVNLTPAPPR